VQRLNLHHTPAKGSVQGSILPIQGTWCQSSIWTKYWTKWLAEVGYQSWVMDYPVEGTTSISNQVDLTHQVINQIENEFGVSLSLFGHSRGGAVAQKVASERDLASIVLLGSSAPWPICNIRWPLVSEFWRYLPQILFSRLFRPSNAVLDRLEFHRFPNGEELMADLIPDSGRTSLEILLSLTKVDHLRCDALIVAGQYDRIMPVGIQKALHEKYGRRADYLERPHGHMPMLEENSGSTLREIVDWLNIWA
jgi:pimeloyl-ACP methyl ester carboxylesterase